MDTDHLELFIEVAKQGSFAKAARRLERDPSQISRTIATLENSLGIRLFQRSTRSLTLTEEGKNYLINIEPIIEDLHHATEKAKQINNAPQGTLKLTASVAFGHICLLPLLKAFQNEYPSISLDLSLTDNNLDLLENGIDLACRPTPAFDSNLIGHKLFRTQYKVCATPEYIEKEGKPKSPDDLKTHSCLVFSMPQYRSNWLFKSTNGALQSVDISSTLSISNALALLECSLSHMGPALLADWMVDKYIETGQLINLFPKHSVTATDFETSAWLLYPSRNHLPLKTQVMIRFLKEHLGNVNREC